MNAFQNVFLTLLGPDGNVSTIATARLERSGDISSIKKDP